ncbi:MAG: S8 family serine peptidase, partial [Lachnospiraceae bacterium]|nr:S8 family serine peptidase [Lachnospiraceae bacterium]
MASQKMENLLNLSLEATAGERERSLELPVGVTEDRWELIIKYHGDLRGALERADLIRSGSSDTLEAEYLLPGYAILTAGRAEIERLSGLPEIDYIEKPKALYEGEITIRQGSLASCVQEVTDRGLMLSGLGCLVGVPDSGIDYKNSTFLDSQGRSRILYLWDQTLQPDAERGWNAPEGFYHGVEFTKEQLDESILSGEELTFDRSGHGTGVTAIAAGREGVAPEAGLLIVKLGSGREAEGSSRTTELMRAVSWMLQKAQSLGMPLAVNISYGSTYGSHDGTSLLETFLNNAAESYKIVLCVGSGNEGAAAGHTQVILDGQKQVECSVADRQRACNLSIWKNYADSFRLEILSPGGGRLEIPLEGGGKRNFTLDGTTILFYGGEPAPYTKVQEYYFDFLGNPYITAGIWSFVLTPIRILHGVVSFYLPSAEALNRGTNFFRPTAAV